MLDVDPTTPAPNHHADYPGFRGFGGLVAAATMIVGRRGVAATAARLVG